MVLHYVSVITQRNGDSVLNLAARRGDTKFVSLLLDAGADIHYQRKVLYAFCQPSQYAHTFHYLYSSTQHLSNMIFQSYYAMHTVEPPIMDPNSGPPPYNGPLWMYQKHSGSNSEFRTVV